MQKGTVMADTLDDGPDYEPPEAAQDVIQHAHL